MQSYVHNSIDLSNRKDNLTDINVFQINVSVGSLDDKKLDALSSSHGHLPDTDELVCVSSEQCLTIS